MDEHSVSIVITAMLVVLLLNSVAIVAIGSLFVKLFKWLQLEGSQGESKQVFVTKPKRPDNMTAQFYQSPDVKRSMREKIEREKHRYVRG